MPTRNVVITDRQAAFVEEVVANGEYQNASEVLREGLRLVQERRAEHARKLEALRAAVVVGIEDIDAGRYTEFESVAAFVEHCDEEAERIIAEVESELKVDA